MVRRADCVRRMFRSVQGECEIRGRSLEGLRQPSAEPAATSVARGGHGAPPASQK